MQIQRIQGQTSPKFGIHMPDRKALRIAVYEAQTKRLQSLYSTYLNNQHQIYNKLNDPNVTSAEKTTLATQLNAFYIKFTAALNKLHEEMNPKK